MPSSSWKTAAADYQKWKTHLQWSCITLLWIFCQPRYAEMYNLQSAREVINIQTKCNWIAHQLPANNHYWALWLKQIESCPINSCVLTTLSMLRYCWESRQHSGIEKTTNVLNIEHLSTREYRTPLHQGFYNNEMTPNSQHNLCIHWMCLYHTKVAVWELQSG